MSSNSQNGETQSPLTPIQWVHAYWVSRCIHVVAKLGIADLLKDGPQHCDTLADATSTHSDSIYRILRALAGTGIFIETQPRCFELTPLASSLQSNFPDSIRDMAILRGEDHYYRSWGDLMYSLKTGKSAFEYLYGMDLFEYNETNPLAGEIFDRAMTSSKNSYIRFLEAYDFSSIGKLVDIGGGKGSFLSTVLESNPHMTGILFDQVEVIDRTIRSPQIMAINDRCQCMGGSFFESIPLGGDAYVLKHILQDWDDQRSLEILRNCHAAMGEHSRLLIIDFVLPPANQPSSSKFIDINMLVMCPGGRIRTEEEFHELLKLAGFKLRQVFSTGSEVSILEGIKLETRLTPTRLN